MLIIQQVPNGGDDHKDDIIIRVLGEVIVIKTVEIRNMKRAAIGVQASPAVLINRRSVDEKIQQAEHVLSGEPESIHECPTPLTTMPRLTNLDRVYAGAEQEVHGNTDLAEMMDEQRHRIGG